MIRIYYLLLIFTLLNTNILIAQEVPIDSIVIDNGKIQKDTVRVYTITLIEESTDEYVIHAEREDFYFRVKSKKQSCANLKRCNTITVGKKYQLDVRDYNNKDSRSLYSTKFEGMGFCEPIGNGEALCEYDPRFLRYSQVLNLKGLCLIKEEE